MQKLVCALSVPLFSIFYHIVYALNMFRWDHFSDLLAGLPTPTHSSLELALDTAAKAIFTKLCSGLELYLSSIAFKLLLFINLWTESLKFYTSCSPFYKISFSMEVLCIIQALLLCLYTSLWVNPGSCLYPQFLKVMMLSTLLAF